MTPRKTKTHLKKILVITIILLLCTSLTVFAEEGEPTPTSEPSPKETLVPDPTELPEVEPTETLEPEPTEILALTPEEETQPELSGSNQLSFTITLPEYLIQKDHDGFDLLSV